MKKDEIKRFVKKKGKWEVYEMEKGGQPFKLLVEADGHKVKQIMEKPDFKMISGVNLLSGAHIITDFPERNHVDYYESGVKTIVEETPNKFFSYWTSGATWGI